nr:MAG TPA: hypothetical protein [Caudoviricetes sp.]
MRKRPEKGVFYLRQVRVLPYSVVAICGDCEAIVGH